MKIIKLNTKPATPRPKPPVCRFACEQVDPENCARCKGGI